MPPACLPTIDRRLRPKKLCRNLCTSSNCSAKSAWIFWKHLKRAERKQQSPPERNHLTQRPVHQEPHPYRPIILVSKAVTTSLAAGSEVVPYHLWTMRTCSGRRCQRDLRPRLAQARQAQQAHSPIPCRFEAPHTMKRRHHLLIPRPRSPRSRKEPLGPRARRRNPECSGRCDRIAKKQRLPKCLEHSELAPLRPQKQPPRHGSLWRLRPRKELSTKTVGYRPETHPDRIPWTSREWPFRSHSLFTPMLRVLPLLLWARIKPTMRTRGLTTPQKSRGIAAIRLPNTTPSLHKPHIPKSYLRQRLPQSWRAGRRAR